MDQQPETGQDRDFIQSIERGFSVLLAFDEDLPEPTLGELASKTGFSRPAVRRILLTLQRLGYVRQAGSRWSLTPRVLTIGQHFAATHGVVEVAQPHMHRLTELTRESASLSQLDDTAVVYVGRVHVRRIMGMNVDIGSRLPAHATSMGRVLLAWAEASVVDRVLDEVGLPALTESTVTDPIEFRNVLHTVRKDGFAVVDSELEDGFISASAPVRNAKGEVVAALAHSTSRLRGTAESVREQTVPILLEVAADISADLAALDSSRRVLTTRQRDGFF